MNDKKTSEDEFIDESFENEFEFGEEVPGESGSPPPFKKGRDPRNFLAIGISIAVIGFIGYFGYRFFYATPSKPESIQPTIAQSTSTRQPKTQAPIAQSTSTRQPKTQAPIAETTQKAAIPSNPVPGKPQPTAFTESEVAELLKPKDNVPEKQKELFTPAEASKVAETQMSGNLPEAAVVVIPKANTLPLEGVEGVPESVQLANPPSESPLTPAEMQAFNQETQKTLAAFTKLNQQMENNLNQIKYLDSYTREVSLTVEKLNAQITAMDNRIQALTNLANSLSKDLGKVRNEVGYVKRVIGDEGLDMAPAPTARRQRNTVEYPYPSAIEDGIDCNGAVTTTRRRAVQGEGGNDLEYVVHAVIPGRAWLKTAKGQIMTVTEGENIGNYGKILVIDAANGVVLTSSGVTFR